MASYAARGLRLRYEQAGGGRPVVEGAQHLVNLERPDRFNELLLGLLAQA